MDDVTVSGSGAYQRQKPGSNITPRQNKRLDARMASPTGRTPAISN